jgi:hypothetical protein
MKRNGIRMRNRSLRAKTIAFCLALVTTTAAAADWLQFGYDTAHSGFNREESGYPTPSGNKILRHYTLSAGFDRVDGAPVYLSGVTTGSGTRNLLFALSNNGTIMALDADSPTLSVVWSHQPTGSGTATRGYGAPAIDPDRQHVYAYGLDGKVHKYAVGDGTEDTSGGWPQVSTLKPDVDKGASGLAIATAQGGATFLYSVTDGYVGDAGDYQGHLTAIDLGDGSQKVFNSLCSDKTMHFCKSGTMGCTVGVNDCASRRNGIWGRPGAIYDAGTDRVFVMTGNGPYNAAVLNWGDSLLALNADGSGNGSGQPVDSYTPDTYANLDSADADFGSASIALLPPPPGTAAQYQHIAMAGGKDGCVRLVNLADLSGMGGPGNVGGEIQKFDFAGGGSCATGSNSSDIKPQPAVWVDPSDQSTWIYIATYTHGLAAYRVALDVDGKPSLAKQWPSGSGTAANGTSPVVANGVLYYLSGSKLRALNARTGEAIVTGGPWNTTSVGGQHWQSPIVVNGRAYVFDDTSPQSQLWVYQIDGAFKSGFE